MSMKEGGGSGGVKCLCCNVLLGFYPSVCQAVGVHVLFPFLLADACAVQEEDEGHVGGFLFSGTGGTVPSGPFFLRPLCPTRYKSTLSSKFPSAITGRRGRFQVAHFQTTVPSVPFN